MGLVERLLDTCIRLPRTKRKRRWRIREKMIAYQDLLSLLVAFTFLLFWTLALREGKMCTARLLIYFAVYFLSQLMYMGARCFYRRWIRQQGMFIAGNCAHGRRCTFRGGCLDYIFFSHVYFTFGRIGKSKVLNLSRQLYRFLNLILFHMRDRG